MVLSLVMGFLGGYAEGTTKRKQSEASAAAKLAQDQADYDRKRAAYQDQSTPEYWGLELKKEQVWSARHKRLTEGLEGTTHAMGLEGMAERFIHDNGGIMPDVGSESETAWLSMAASGSSYEESLGGKDEWSDRKNRQGRGVVGALRQTGLDLGNDLKGNSFSLKPDRYGKGVDQLDFLSEAVDEFSPFLGIVMSKEPDFAFDDAMKGAGINSGTPEYDAAKKKVEEAKLFWSSGFGASFLESEGQGAPQAAQQALDRVGRARGIMNGRRHASVAPPSERRSAKLMPSMPVIPESAGGKPKSRGGPVDGVTGAAVKTGKSASVFPTKHPVVDNADGTQSNVMTATVELGGKHLVIPTMVEGKQLDIDKAIGVARKEGLENYPTFDTAAEALEFSKDVHDRVDEDGNMQPKTSARDELIYPDRPKEGPGSAGFQPHRGYDARRMDSRTGSQGYEMQNQTYQQANQAMPQEMAVAPDFSPAAMGMQYRAVKEIIELMVNSPQQVTPAMLETLELKQKQGWWPHLIDGPLEQFKSKISGSNHQDAVDALYRGMQLNRPKTHMLGRFR